MMKFAAVIAILASTLLLFQNCGQGFETLSRGSLSATAAVDFKVPYGAQNVGAQLSSSQSRVQSPEGLMARLKYKGCNFDGLLTDNALPQFLELLRRSSCESLHRAVETWANPPQFEFIKTQIDEIKTRTGKKYDYGMFIAEAIALDKPYADDQGVAFDFAQMCKPGTSDFWGPKTCVPTVSSPEYRRYLRYIIMKAASLGINNVVFGQTGHQDVQMQLGAFIPELRSIAAGQGTTMLFGQQPNGHQPSAYLKSFDYIISPLYVDVDFSQPCVSGTFPNCQAVLFHPSVLGNAHNVIVEMDWASVTHDDTHRFAARAPADRKSYLEGRVKALFESGVGFMMPFRQWLTGDTSGKYCFGPSPYLYSPHREYGCKDEDFLNAFLRGEFLNPPLPQPVMDQAQARSIVLEAFTTILGRTAQENSNDQAGIDYWINQLMAGYPKEAFERVLVASDEAFVRKLYKNILGRTADMAGLKYYLTQIQSGSMTREHVRAALDAICKAGTNGECSGGTSAPPANPNPPPTSNPTPSLTEYRSIAAGIFMQVLGRSSDEVVSDVAGIDYWANRLRNGYSTNQMEADLRASNEYFVRQLYKNILRRNPDKAGLQYWVGLLNAGSKSRAQAQADFNHLCSTGQEACR